MHIPEFLFSSACFSLSLQPSRNFLDGSKVALLLLQEEQLRIVITTYTRKRNLFTKSITAKVNSIILMLGYATDTIVSHYASAMPLVWSETDKSQCKEAEEVLVLAADVQATWCGELLCIYLDESFSLG